MFRTAARLALLGVVGLSASVTTSVTAATPVGKPFVYKQVEGTEALRHPAWRLESR